MPSIELKYGKQLIDFEFDEDQFQILTGSDSRTRLSDIEINQKLNAPVGQKVIEDIVSPNETVLLVVPDATRETGSGQIVNLLIRRLIANGTAAFDIRIIFATGIHRKVTPEEKQQLLTPFIAQRIKTLDHDPRDIAALVRLGETKAGIPIELNRALLDHDHVILIGGINFHYFAGFTGGRKLVCPGLASSKTVNATHKLAFDCDRKSRREGVATGSLEGNAVHEAFVEAAKAVRITYAMSAMVNDVGEVVDLYCGDWLASHQIACEKYAAAYTVQFAEKREVVIASCGGYPYDINMIQSHKALEAATHVCADGGKIILLAECAEGLGRSDFLKWFNAENSEQLAEQLCERYQVNGQTAWNLLRRAERFRVEIMTCLSDAETSDMRLKKIGMPELGKVSRSNGYIMPDAAKIRAVPAGK